MNPCAGCKHKGNCPEKCKPKQDYIRHIRRLNRKLRKNERLRAGGGTVVGLGEC